MGNNNRTPKGNQGNQETNSDKAEILKLARQNMQAAVRKFMDYIGEPDAEQAEDYLRDQLTDDLDDGQ